MRVSGKRQAALFQADETLLPDNEAAQSGYESLMKLLDLMTMYRMEQYCELDPSIIRGLAYYTGTVFECNDTKGELRAIFENNIQLMRPRDLAQSSDGPMSKLCGFASLRHGFARRKGRPR